MSVPKKVLIELHYLPSIAWFQYLYWADEFVIEACENYQKQNYRNRCHILTANGMKELVVPVKHSAEKVLFKDIEIDNTQHWQKIHWRTIKSAYGKSAFFEHYGYRFEKMYQKQYDKLWDWNMDILTLCLAILKKEDRITLSQEYENKPENTIIDLRSALHPKKLQPMEQPFVSGHYIQVFGNKFVENLSVLDLIFCEGPYASKWLSSTLIA